MDKRDFLKKFSCLGLCACTNLIVDPDSAHAKTNDEECDKLKDQNWRLEWRLNHAKRQFCTLLNEIEPEIPSENKHRIMETMGRNCAKSLNWAEKYKGNPEGFFKHMHNHSGEKISFNENGDRITIITRDRDCDCPIIDSSKAPAYYCDCSLGWQKETYETILGKPVDVVVKESVIRGSKRCVFEVTINA